jgi:hypothetical protein
MFRKFFWVSIIFSMFFSLHGAEVTEVASSFDYKNPFDFNLDVKYLSTQHFGSIKREYNTMIDGAYQDVNGNYYYATTDRRVETKEYKGNPHLLHMQKLLFDAEIGLYHNLSLSLQLPVILSEQYKMVLFDTSVPILTIRRSQVSSFSRGPGTLITNIKVLVIFLSVFSGLRSVKKERTGS